MLRCGVVCCAVLCSQLYREREELSEKLAAAMHSSNSEKQQRAPSALATSVAAAPGPAGPLSPTGMKLDQRATSQLIWSTACSNPFTQQQQQQLKGQGEGVGVQQGVSTNSTNCITQDAAAACDTGSCLDSFSTAQSQLFDISPLRGANSSSRVHAAAAADATPSSKTPAALTAADAAAGAVAAAAAAAGDAGTPLSAQSLSAFSPAAVAVASPRRRRALQALSPLRRCDLQKATSDSAAAAGMGHHCSSSGCSDAGSSSSSSSCAALSDLLTPRGLNAQQQQQAPGTSSRAGALMGATLPPLPGTACSRLGASTPRTTPRSNTCAAFGSSVSIAGGNAGSSVGLSLGREFRVAAVDSLWPACPAAARGSTGLDLAAVCAGSAVCSHSLWLQGAEEEAGGEVDMEGVDEVGMCHSPGEGVCPRALTDWDFLEWGCGSSSSCGELGGGCDGDVESLVGVGGGVGVATDGGVGRGQQGKNRVQAVVSRVVWVGVSAALAAAGGAAAWRHKQAEVLQVLELAHRGGIMAATQAQRCAAGGVKHLQKCCRGAAGKAGQVLPAVPAAGSQ